MMEQILWTLYPKIEPYNSFKLEVSSLHRIYVEECGNPNGIPVIVLHGGPGAGTYPQLRRFFDPLSYRIILFDQRGCGKSKPHLALAENTTQDLVEDIEKIRRHLGITSWVVFGGSWGSTLGLAYGETHPERVRALILRGIYFGGQDEMRWFYAPGGASMIFPDEWEKFISMLPSYERSYALPGYYRLLTQSDRTMREHAAVSWGRWEAVCSELVLNEEFVAEEVALPQSLQQATIEAYYMMHQCFLEEGQLLRKDNIAKIARIPGIIVHGRYDTICPFKSAWDLHQAWPEAKFIVSRRAGHAACEVETTHHLVEATNGIRDMIMRS